MWWAAQAIWWSLSFSAPLPAGGRHVWRGLLGYASQRLPAVLIRGGLRQSISKCPSLREKQWQIKSTQLAGREAADGPLIWAQRSLCTDIIHFHLTASFTAPCRQIKMGQVGLRRIHVILSVLEGIVFANVCSYCAFEPNFFLTIGSKTHQNLHTPSTRWGKENSHSERPLPQRTMITLLSKKKKNAAKISNIFQNPLTKSKQTCQEYPKEVLKL